MASQSSIAVCHRRGGRTQSPTRGVRLPEFIDRLVEGRTTPALTRATVIIDLI